MFPSSTSSIFLCHRDGPIFFGRGFLPLSQSMHVVSDRHCSKLSRHDGALALLLKIQKRTVFACLAVVNLARSLVPGQIFATQKRNAKLRKFGRGRGYLAR